MKKMHALSAIVALALAPALGVAWADDAPLSRADVKMDRTEFLKTHTWDAANEVWILKPGVAMPEGVKSRSEIKAERNEFLRNNRWDETKDEWTPVTGGPRDMSKLSRAEVKMETRMFDKTHRFDEVSGTWVETHPRKPKPKTE